VSPVMLDGVHKVDSDLLVIRSWVVALSFISQRAAMQTSVKRYANWHHDGGPQRTLLAHWLPLDADVRYTRLTIPWTDSGLLWDSPVTNSPTLAVRTVL
jgi:hypothetical protein